MNKGLNYKFLLGLVSFVTGLITYLQRQKFIDEGEQRALAEALRVQAEEMDRATRARDRAADAAKRVPNDKPLDDDGFRRD